MKSKALSIVVFLLAVVLFGLLFVSHRQEQRQTAHMQQLQKGKYVIIRICPQLYFSDTLFS